MRSFGGFSQRRAMRYRLLLASLLVATTAGAITPRAWQESQSATRSAPTLATEGMSLKEVFGYRLTACATVGNIATACTLKAYIYSDTIGIWVRSAADSSGVGYLDWDIETEDVGKACVTFPDQQPVSRRGRILYAASGCDALTLYIEGNTL